MNSVNLLGRMVADPELNFSPGSGTAVCRFRLAINRPYSKDKTDFITCVAFGKTGETIAEYMTKGRQLAVQGHIQTGNYEDKNGIKRYTTDVIVSKFRFVDNIKKNATQSNIDNNSNEEPPIDYGDTPF